MAARCASATICHAPSIGELVEVLDQPAIPQFPPFIQLKAGNEKPPVFIAHGLGGRAKFWDLVKHIYTDRAIYGIHAKGIDGIETPFERIEDMAKYYLEALYEFQPRGPYILVGYSFGGLVALEMAQRMHEDGREMALLVLVDTYPHPHFLPPGRRIALLAKRTKRHFVEMRRRSLKGAWQYFLRGMANRLHIQRLSVAVAPESARGEGAQEPSRLSFARTTLRIRASDLRSLKYYRPRFYPGTIKFVRPETNAYFPNEPEAVWEKLAAKLEVDTIPGDHLGVILTGYGLGQRAYAIFKRAALDGLPGRGPNASCADPAPSKRLHSLPE